MNKPCEKDSSYEKRKILITTKNGDCIAVFQPTMLCWVETKHVADYEFIYSSSFVIWIYHKGEFCTIEEAWEQGLLTKEQIALMAEYHKKAAEYIREYYQAQLPE